jgi:hypothetical protein
MMATTLTRETTVMATTRSWKGKDYSNFPLFLTSCHWVAPKKKLVRNLVQNIEKSIIKTLKNKYKIKYNSSYSYYASAV